jgi:hypothetical protein
LVAGAACGAASWASTEPVKATPAISREAIANLRTMMSLERLMPRTRPEPGYHGWRDS